jgi:hypothetical protein
VSPAAGRAGRCGWRRGGGSRDVGKNLEEEKKISMVICEVHWISLKWLLDYSIDL